MVRPIIKRLKSLGDLKSKKKDENNHEQAECKTERATSPSSSVNSTPSTSVNSTPNNMTPSLKSRSPDSSTPPIKLYSPSPLSRGMSASEFNAMQSAQPSGDRPPLQGHGLKKLPLEKLPNIAESDSPMQTPKTPSKSPRTPRNLFGLLAPKKEEPEHDDSYDTTGSDDEDFEDDDEGRVDLKDYAYDNDNDDYDINERELVDEDGDAVDSPRDHLFQPFS
ncbi:hypothetical protein DFA_01508 [Cavenderia fasciculata]|uniref:Uncharacterized protein n=1 Tax=Cavenderia fasciculata TaxID=261658 RepID=F4PT46_CACFS|nr:uncharacterized protein DFA_01508 [Cavenderia fasciculata]EGG21622.1 hypothetical protein DFA_01508 [Cavenderia fasciculata]|eukprot:XP_004359472.1 hypothetical protein DFA_01508 [Cavenderia fasciculata]